MYRVNSQTGQGFKAHDRQFFSQCAALGPAACTCVRAWMDGAGRGRKSTRSVKAHSSTTDTNAHVMLLPAYPVRKPGVLLEAFVVSVGVVALAELGDKTQLLALVLAARFRAPLPVLGGILTATLANHLAAGAVGTLLAAYVSPAVMRWALAASFLATALWMLIPDKDSGLGQRPARFGAYGTIADLFLSARDRRQDADRHRGARRQIQHVHAGGRRHLAGHDARGRAGGAARRGRGRRNRRCNWCIALPRPCSWYSAVLVALGISG